MKITDHANILARAVLRDDKKQSQAAIKVLKEAVTQTADAGRIIVEVTDRGPGFDPGNVRPEWLGLAGLHERVESLGGLFEPASPETGTKVRMPIDMEEVESL